MVLTSDRCLVNNFRRPRSVFKYATVSFPVSRLLLLVYKHYQPLHTATREKAHQPAQGSSATAAVWGIHTHSKHSKNTGQCLRITVYISSKQCQYVSLFTYIVAIITERVGENLLEIGSVFLLH